MLILPFAAFACTPPSHASGDLPAPKVDAPATQTSTPQTAVFAGGCFWCTEAAIAELKGVSEVVSGYSGGSAETANYEQVCTGRTHHAEAIKITFDPSQISFGRLLQVFFTIHDPTTLDAQGPDHGSQYRSAIFFADADQERIARAYIKQLEEAKAFSRPIVTTLEPLKAFYPAEKYHQDYARENPDQPYIRQWAAPKVEKVRKKFADEVKSKP